MTADLCVGRDGGYKHVEGGELTPGSVRGRGTVPVDRVAVVVVRKVEQCVVLATFQTSALSTVREERAKNVPGHRCSCG